MHRHTRSSTARPRASLALKGTVVAIAFALGALLALGCLIAALFEAQGFGRPRDNEPRLGHLVALALGFAASIGAPVVLWRRFMPESAPGWAVAAVSVAAVAGAILVLGISFR